MPDPWDEGITSYWTLLPNWAYAGKSSVISSEVSTEREDPLRECGDFLNKTLGNTLRR